MLYGQGNTIHTEDVSVCRSIVVTSNTHMPILTGMGHKCENRDRLALQTIHHRIITHYDIQLQHRY